MNQDTGWFNNYDRCGLDQRNHPPSRYNNVATIPQPNQQPEWEPPPGPPPPLAIGHNVQSLHPYGGGGGFMANQFHPAYTPRPVGSYQSYTPYNPGYKYRNNQAPRMRHNNNNFRWQRRNGHDRSRSYPNNSAGNYQRSYGNSSNQEEPNAQASERETPEETPQQSSGPHAETESEVLAIRPRTTESSPSTTIHIIEDVDDNDTKPKIKEEDKKIVMECIDLSDAGDCPEEDLNKFEFDSRTKVLDKLCGTMEEAKFIEGLKQFKTILKEQMIGIRLKSRLIQLLTKYILFLGTNYKSIASGFVEEYLDLMEDVIVMFCQVITDFINLQIADNKKTHLVRLAFQIKYIMSYSLLFRLDSIMHCLFKVQLPPVYLEGHSLIWTDVFIYFLRNSKFDPKHDDLLRIFVAWKRLISIRPSKDTDMINESMFQSLRKTPEELASSPYLKEFMEKYHDNPRCNVQEMLSKYWKWWKEERPKQHWADLEEPTYIQPPGVSNLEYQSTNICLSHSSSSETVDDEIGKLFEDRRTGKIPGLTQLGRKTPYARQNNVFWPTTASNIFDDSTVLNIDFDYYDESDLIVAEPRVVETVVLDSDDDDVIYIEDDNESSTEGGVGVAEKSTEDVAEKSTEDVEKLMEESSINDLNENTCEGDKSCKELVNEEPVESSNNSKSNVEDRVGSSDENKQPEESVIDEMCDSFALNYPEDTDSNDEDDDLDFPTAPPNEPKENQDNLASTSNSKSIDDIFDKWGDAFYDGESEMQDFFNFTKKKSEKSTLMFADRPKSPKESTSIFDEEPKSPETRTLMSGEQPISLEETTSIFGEEPKSPETRTLTSAERPKSPKTTTLTSAERPKSPETTTAMFVEQPKSPEKATLMFAERPKSPETSKLMFAEGPKSPDTSKLMFAERPKSPETSKLMFAEGPKTPDTSKLMFVEQPKSPETSKLIFAEHPKSPEKSNAEDITEKTCDESCKTETVSRKKESIDIAPEKVMETTPNDIEELPDQQQELVDQQQELVNQPQELANNSEKSSSSEGNVLPNICMQNLREVLNEMEEDWKQTQEESDENKDSCLKEDALILEEPLTKHLNLSTDSGDLVIDEDVDQQEPTDDEDNLDNSHNYAAIVQAACSDDDNNEFALMNGHDAAELSEFEDGDAEAPHSKPDTNHIAEDSDEISSPPWEPLDADEVQEHFDSEKQRLENESFEKERPFESIINSSEALTTLEPMMKPEVSSLAKDSVEPIIDPKMAASPAVLVEPIKMTSLSPAVTVEPTKSPELTSLPAVVVEPIESPKVTPSPAVSVEPIKSPEVTLSATEPLISPKVTPSCQMDPETFESWRTVIEESTVETSQSTSKVINLASPCHDNSETITIQCQLVLKQEVNEVEEHPTQDYQLSKYPNYSLAVPQRQEPVNEGPPQSGSQPYSPPSIRIGNAVSALDENSTMLYTPILQDSHEKIEPAIVPDVLPQQDLPKQNAVPPKPETSPKVNNNHVNKFKIVKVHNPPAVKGISSNPLEDTSKDIYAVVYGPKTLDKSQKEETPEKPKKKSRRGSDVPHVRSRRRDANPKVYKGKKSSTEKLAKPLSPQQNGLFEYAIEGPTGKPLWNTTPNILWEDDEDPYENRKSPITVKSDKQLKKKGRTLVSILKKPKFANDYNIDYNQPQESIDYNLPKHIINLSTKDCISDMYDIQKNEELKKEEIKLANEERAREMARLMMLKAQQDKHDFGDILGSNFRDMEDNKRDFAKPWETRKVRFEGVTAEHSYRNNWNGERTPEKRKRDNYLQDDKPPKKARLTVRNDLIEENVRHYPIKVSTPLRKTGLHVKGHKADNPATGLVPKLNGIITKKPAKNINFANTENDSPVPLPKPNGVRDKGPGKSLAFMNNKHLKEESPASSGNPTKGLRISIVEKSKQVEAPVKPLAAKKHTNFSLEESEIVETPKRPNKSIILSDMKESTLESPAQAPPTKKPGKSLSFADMEILEPTSKKSYKSIKWSNTEKSNVETSGLTLANKSNNEGLWEELITTKSDNSHDLFNEKEHKVNSPGESKVDSPASIELAQMNSDNFSLSTRKKGGRPPGAKNKRLSFSNIRKPKPRRPTVSKNTHLSLPTEENPNFPTLKESNVAEANEISTSEKSYKNNVNWSNMEPSSKVENPVTGNNGEVLLKELIIEITALEATEIFRTEKSKLDSPSSTEADQISFFDAPDLEVPVMMRRKGGRPPGAKNKRFRFTNERQPKIRRPAGSRDVSAGLNLSTVAAVADVLDASNDVEPISEPSPKPKQTRTRNVAQKQTQSAQLRGKTTGNDSCDVTDSKPGRRRRVYKF